MNSCIQHVDQSLQGLQTNSRIASGKCIAPEKHGRPHIFPRIRIPHGAGMADDQISLQLRRFLLRDDHIGELAEPCGQSVDDSFFFQFLFNVVSGLLYGNFRFRSQFHFFVIPAYTDDLFYRQVFSVNKYCHSFLSISHKYLYNVCIFIRPSHGAFSYLILYNFCSPNAILFCAKTDFFNEFQRRKQSNAFRKFHYFIALFHYRFIALSCIIIEFSEQNLYARPFFVEISHLQKSGVRSSFFFVLACILYTE